MFQKPGRGQGGAGILLNLGSPDFKSSLSYSRKTASQMARYFLRRFPFGFLQKPEYSRRLSNGRLNVSYQVPIHFIWFGSFRLASLL